MRSLSELWTVRSLEELTYRQRLIVLYALGLATVILFYTVVYNWGMRALEGDQHSIFRSFQTVVETMTTTGYGADSPWETPWMNALVVLMQLSGIAIGFFTLRVLIIPLFKHTPVRLDERLSPKTDHVIITEYHRDSDVLLEELERLGISYVLIESTEEEAQRLSNEGYQVIHGDPETAETLERASIADAAVLIADAGDRNTSITLMARDLNENIRVVALTESERQNRALERVGVDTAVAPHALIGRRLAHKAVASLTIPEGIPVAEDVEVREVLIRRDSPLRGEEIRDTPFSEHPELTLVAGWFDGDLHLPPAPTDRLTPNTVLVVAGPEAAIEDVRAEVSGVRSAREHSEIICAGAGEGGQAAVTALPDSVSITTIDIEDREDVDFVGDAGEPETLEAAGVEEATALIVTVDDDATTLLTIALARSLTDEIEILARVTDTERVRSAFSAGADYVLSIQRATARLLAREVYGEDIVSPVSQIRLIRSDAAPFAGQTLQEANESPKKGWVVVGVERDGAFQSDETAQISEADTVWVAGTDTTIQEFEQGTGPA